MIKRILVALDTDTDTTIAIRYAADVAERYGAEVVGLAVVDLGRIESESRGGAVGSMYYAEKLRENLTEETRKRAAELIREFEAELENSGIKHSDIIEEGVPFRRILEDMKYHDLLVVGREPHFFYGDPEMNTHTLERVIKETVGPALVVGDEYRQVRRVMIAYDGSPASARTLQYFTHLLPFGPDVQVELVNVHGGDHGEAELMLDLTRSYLEVHGLETRATILGGGDEAEQIAEHAVATDADVVVAGAHSVSKWREIAFGSTTTRLLKRSPRPLFIQH